MYTNTQSQDVPFEIKTEFTVKRMAASLRKTYLLTSCGHIMVWPDSNYKQVPQKIQYVDNSNLPNVADIAVGERMKILLSESNQAFILDVHNDLYIQRPTSPNICVTQVSCGKEHCLLLTQQGQVYSFGCGSRGQLGLGTLESFKEPSLLEALEGVTVTLVSTGGWHSAAVGALNDLYMWGWNEAGQVGLPCQNIQKINEETQFIQMLTEKRFDANNSDRKNQKSNEIDHKSYNDEEMQPKRQKMEESTGSVSNNSRCISNNLNMSVNQKNDSVSNQIDIGNTAFNDTFKISNLAGKVSSEQSLEYVNIQTLPCLIDMPDGSDVQEVDCGGRHTAAVTVDGKLFTWGWNGYGQLGHGDTLSRDSPEMVRYFVQENMKVVSVKCNEWTTMAKCTTSTDATV